MNFKMKTRFLALAAALVCCYSCIETDSTLGGNLVPAVETYSFYSVDIPIDGISMQMADNLSGYSDSRVTIGAIREPEYGLTSRASSITLVPMFIDKLDMGKNPIFKRFHFSIARDTTCVLDPEQANILQRVHVYGLDEPVDPSVDYDVNRPIPHGTEIITKGTPVYNGRDSLTFDFSEEFGKKYLTITQDDLKDMKTYLGKFPGIYLETEVPEKDGGRINMLDLQLSYDKNNGYILGNFATLNYSAEFNGVRKDTTVVFWYGATDFFKIDSLFDAYSGTFPQYALNYTGQETRGRTGEAQERIWIEGGGGLKPVIPALGLKHQVEQAIIQLGGNPGDAIINKASLIFPFDFPEDYKDMTYWPYRLSPTCRFVDEDDEETATYMGLTDASSSSENQGDVDRSLARYAPDITYHMQEILKIDESATDKATTKNLLAGYYDIWLLVMAQEVQTTVSSTSKEQQEMYQYLAYQSYYNNMYGGYGYGGYGGYGGGYSSYYNNYLTYAMLAQQASQSYTSTSTTVKLDVGRFYRASLHGPQSNGEVPTLRLVFALPNKEEE